VPLPPPPPPTHIHTTTPRFELLLPKRTSLRHRVPCGDEGFLDFLAYLLTVDPAARPTAEEALGHPWLTQAYPPADPITD
jgi:serine/threonine protein kinase